MPLEAALFSAALMGLLGSTHCMGMCGGIVSALTLGVGNRSRSMTLFYLCAYNGGRIASYAVAGALAGLVSLQLFQLVPSEAAPNIARWVFAGFTVALGFYLTGWWKGLAVLERLGGKLWALLQPLGRQLLPIDSPLKALACGLVWGWLPCGMVYTALAWSLTAGDVVTGTMTMAAFGLGTLPSLLLVGAGARFLRNPALRQTLATYAGIFLLAVGLYLLFVPALHTGHVHA